MKIHTEGEVLLEFQGLILGEFGGLVAEESGDKTTDVKGRMAAARVRDQYR